jgi:hypothetical protein
VRGRARGRGAAAPPRARAVTARLPAPAAAPQAVFASTPGGIPPEYNIAEQTVTCIQVPQSAQPEGPTGVLVDAYQKRYN